MTNALVLALLALMVSQPGAENRPRDPWVIRGVLDEQPRVLTIALDDELWAAYDTETCSLIKAWDGDVDYTGSVYDTLHGPQPEIDGEVWLEGLDSGPHFEVHVDDVGGTMKRIPLAPQWRGYQFKDGQVHLIYDAPGPHGKMIRITETPEAKSIEGEDGPLGLSRTFHARGLAQNQHVVIAFPMTSEAGILKLQCSAPLIQQHGRRSLLLPEETPIEVISYLGTDDTAAPPSKRPGQEMKENNVPHFLSP